MQRTFKRLSQRDTFRIIAFSLGGASTLTFGYGVWLGRQPLLLESGKDASAWKAKPEIATSNVSLSERFRRAAAIQSGEAQENPIEHPTSQAPKAPAPQTKGHSVFDLEGDADDDGILSWRRATDQICQACESVTGFEFSSLRVKLTNLVVPSWIQILPGLVTKLQNELSMAPWSLSWEIWEEAHDPEANPEIVWDAKVRLSEELCAEEQDFRRLRRKHTAKALARYLGVPESEVHPEDVPVIALCGSGGGLRALVAGASSYLSAHESGLFDCVTYTAGVSGSCWLQTLYYSSIGQLSHERLIHHLKQRLSIHIAYPPAALKLLNQAPTNKFLLSGYVEKLRGVPDSDFGLVDIYGLLLAARLMVPRGELQVSDYDLKVSNQRYYTDDGHQPLPIYTAVRHEIPVPVGDVPKLAKEAHFTTKHYGAFQRFEWTPYEFFCEDLNAGIPTWAMGRRFEAGENVKRSNNFALPEIRVPLLLGIWGSAFCATLSHYYKELRPVLKAAGFDRLDSILAQKDDDLVKVHPIDPAVIPNFVIGLKDKLPASCPESIHDAPHLQLMDAGMSNNLPIYPLLRPGRDVDVIVTFDASADVKNDNWLKMVDNYVRERGVKRWPMGAGWPSQKMSAEEISTDTKLAKIASGVHSTQKLTESKSPQVTNGAEDLGHCTVWVGTTQERNEFMDEPPSHRLRSDGSDIERLESPDAGITLIYLPFLANDKVDGVDPMKSDFMSTWNFIYTPEQLEQVVELARANFDEGKDQTKRAIKAVWQRKKALRLQRERDQMTFHRLV